MTQEDFILAIEEWYLTGNEDSITFLGSLYDKVTQPQWISVEDELPKEHEWILGYSLKRSYVDTYIFNSNVIEAHDITHWMHLSPPPVLSNSENTGKDLKGGEK